MKVYGMRIGSNGVEFPSREDRDKAILTFTHGGSVKVSTLPGVRYSDGDKVFGTYERDTAIVEANCAKCYGVFSTETCQQREVPYRGYGGTDGEFEDDHKPETKWLCDGCYAQWMRDKEIHDAKKTLAGEQAA